MNTELSRNNHYVPEWYQRQFVTTRQVELHYLDLAPEIRILPDGRQIPLKAVRRTPPKNCFSTIDLYTTEYRGILNDEIERYLFGKIDDDGSKAIRALSSGDPRAIHQNFQEIFVYLDAQKLRTPKGLDWIKARYPRLSQMQLMMEMQGLATMHCRMWTESVREIVSAEDSDVKFIVSDHPVTIYNQALPPDAAHCTYPGDPLIEMVGSQTVFVLDPDNCLVLSNLEYAKDPREVDLMRARTNGRYRGSSLVRTDAFIRGRKLTSQEVVTVNYLLKQRARRYVAAGVRDWLYPEKQFNGTWADVGAVLLPRDRLYLFGGEIYVGYKDGSVQYQDEFGRSSGAHAYLAKKLDKAPESNDPCGCGSGHSFESCCSELPQEKRPTWKVYGLRERNLLFYGKINRILKFNEGVTWDDFRRTVSGDQIKEIYEAFGSLWPLETDLTELLPRPNPKRTRMVYFGMIEPQKIGSVILGWLPFFDEIIVVHPFVNPNPMTREYSPIESPDQYKEQILRSTFLLFMLEPFIARGLVHLVPDPTDFDFDFRKEVFASATERTKDLDMSKRFPEEVRELSRIEVRRAFARLPERSLRAQLAKRDPKVPDAKLDLMVKMLKAENEQDPLALLQRMEPGKDNGQLRILKGFSLEVAIYLASLTGAGILTDTKSSWYQLNEHARAASQGADNDALVRATLSQIEFPVCEPQDVMDAIAQGKFGAFRSLLRKIFASAASGDIGTQAGALSQEIASAVPTFAAEANELLTKCPMTGTMELVVPAQGYDLNTARRLLLTFGRATAPHPVPLAIFLKLKHAEENVDSGAT